MDSSPGTQQVPRERLREPPGPGVLATSLLQEPQGTRRAGEEQGRVCRTWDGAVSGRQGDKGDLPPGRGIPQERGADENTGPRAILRYLCSAADETSDGGAGPWRWVTGCQCQLNCIRGQSKLLGGHLLPGRSIQPTLFRHPKFCWDSNRFHH